MMRIIVFLFVTATAGCAGIPTGDGAFAEVFGGTSIISSGNKGRNGGEVRLFVAAAEEVLRQNRKVIIDVPCVSACALFADKARPNVCVTPNAKFLFHKMNRTWSVTRASSKFTSTTKFTEWQEDPPVSQDIKGWVDSQGGFPYYDPRVFPHKDFLVMSYKEAKKYWPSCGGQ